MRTATIMLAVALLCRSSLATEIPKGGVLLLSKAPDGAPSNANNSTVTISANGKSVSFATLASNLAPGSSNGFRQVVQYSRAGTFLGVVSKMNGGSLANLNCGESALSENGRYAAFISLSSLFVDGVIGGHANVFHRDSETGIVQLASARTDGSQVDNAYLRDMSDDGRYVLFTTATSEVVPGVSGGVQRGYVRDMLEGTTELVTLNTDEFVLTTDSYVKRISKNGRFVFFGSNAPQLDGGNHWNIYVRDRVLETTTLLSRGEKGDLSNGNSYLLGASRNGRFIAVQSTATNLVPSLPEGGVIVIDRVTGKLKPVNLSAPNFSVVAVDTSAEISNDGNRMYMRVQYDGGIFLGMSTEFVEVDIKSKKKWSRISLQGKEIYATLMSFRASANGKWIAASTEAEIKEQNGEIDTYLFRAH